jgi:small-conductance mechanosensitive channel
VPFLSAILAAFIFGGLYFRSDRMRQGLEAEISLSTDRISRLTQEVDAEKSLRRDQAAQLTELDASLGEAKSKLTVSEARNVQLGRELTSLKDLLQASRAQEQARGEELASLRTELASGRNATATPAVIAGYEAAIARLEQQLAEAQAALPVEPVPVLTTNRSRTAAVVSVGPSSAFVVINYGANHGAMPEQRLKIQRGTDTLATVHISDVRENHSIAQVRPGTLQAALHKGDFAVLTD